MSPIWGRWQPTSRRKESSHQSIIPPSNVDCWRCERSPRGQCEFCNGKQELARDHILTSGIAKTVLVLIILISYPDIPITHHQTHLNGVWLVYFSIYIHDYRNWSRGKSLHRRYQIWSKRATPAKTHFEGRSFVLRLKVQMYVGPEGKVWSLKSMIAPSPLCRVL